MTLSIASGWSGLDVAVHLVFGTERLLLGRLWCVLRPH
jgi:hypothetical protein